MKIGVLSTSYPRRRGDAAGRFVAELARWMASRGHAVEILAAGPGDTRDGELPVTRVGAGAGLFYDEGAPERLERSLAARARAPVFTAALLAAALRRARRWDAVVSHWLLPCGVVGARLGLPHLAIAHSADVHLAARPFVADAVAAALGRARVAFVAEHLRARLLGAIACPALERSLLERSLVCPMGIDTAALAAARAGDRAAARARLGLAGDARVVAYLGRLVPIKGVPLLVDALPPGATLVIAGEGPLRASLAGRAHLLGEVHGGARDDLFCAADVLCLPSIELAGGRTEGAPLVLLEGMAAGVPVVAAAVPGIVELAGDTAWLFPPGDTAALRLALAAALGGDPARVASAQARASRHGWDVAGPILLAALDPRAATSV